MKRKSVTLGAIALTAAFLLSACSGSGAAKTAAESSKAETAAETTAAETQSEAPTYGDSGSEVLRLAKDSNSPEAREELEKLLAKNDCIQYLSKGCFAADTRFARGGDQFNRVEFYGKGKDRYCKYTIPDRDVTYEWFDGENMYHYQEKDERPSAFLFMNEELKQESVRDMFESDVLKDEEYLVNISDDENGEVYETVRAYSEETVGFSYEDLTGKTIEHPEAYVVITHYVFEEGTDLLTGIRVFLQKNTEPAELIMESSYQWDPEVNKAQPPAKCFDYLKKTDVRTGMIICDPGTDRESKSSIQVPKGTRVYLWSADGTNVFYTDKECTKKAEFTESECIEDFTYYVKTK